MTIEDYVYRNRILAALNNNVILFPDGSFKNNVEWFNQEDLLRTMKRMNKGMDKSRLRDFLDSLTVLKLVDKQEGKKQNNKISIKKTGECLKFKKITMKEDGTSFAITIKRRALHLKREFIITYFEKTNVDYDTLNEQIKLIKKHYTFGDKKFYRLIFLARTFDTEILKEHKKLKKVSGAWNLDLIIVTDNGFSGLKIDDY